MKQPRPSITNLPLSPDEERKRRMIKYSVAMGVRIVCLFVAIFVGWPWGAIPLIGAVFLPYIAVVIANVGAEPHEAEAQRPGNILPMAPPPGGGRQQSGEEPADTHGADAHGANTHGANAHEEDE
ncbi:DUF3099 domain-containing protein [Leifsonia sp. NPDC056824]|uniref:DUF3099 domain-containing protein n=1 Tax=Leifsonia sp. NPDC056824 TaxID=3345953 RepID=UPI00367C6BE9